MPETPNNKMEELLRKHAEKRRGDASGISLHPATRRLLQGEVQRRFPKSGAVGGSSRPFLSLLLAWRGAAVAVCGLVAILGAGVWFFGRDKVAGPEAVESTYAKLDGPTPISPTESAKRGITPESEVSRSEPAPAVPAKAPAPAAPGVSGFGGGSQPSVNYKTMRADTKAKEEIAATEKKIALTEAEPSSLTPAPTTAPAGKAGNADFDQAAISARQQQVVALNDANNNVAMKGAGAAVNSQSQALNAGQFAANNPAAPAATPAPAPSPSVQNSALFNNQQQEMVANAQAPAQTFSRARQQAQAAGLEATTATPQEIQTQAQRFYALKENAAANEATKLASNASTQMRVPLGSVSQVEELRQTRDEAPRLGVLTQFVVQQRGNTVRVIDADNSIYDGAVSEEAAVAGRVQAPALRADRLTREADKSSDRQRMFRVAGTNRTSGQSVVLDAQLPPGGSTQQTFVIIQPLDEMRSRNAVAAQTIPPVPTVPSTTRLKPTRTAQDASFNTNSVLEGSLRVGGAASQPIRARRISP